MDKTNLTFDSYLSDIGPDYEPFVMQIHDALTQWGCTVKLQEAKNGHVVSFADPRTKRVIVNFVSRKKGPVIRIYGDNAGSYGQLINDLPQDMVQEIEKASICRRMHDPAKCNSRCLMGYALTINGTQHKKCRNSCFMFTMNARNTPSILELLHRELQARAV